MSILRMAINLYLRRFAADKSDDRIYTVPTETGVMEDVKKSSMLCPGIVNKIIGI